MNDCTPEALGWRERDCRRGRGPQAGGTNDGPATQQGSGGSDCTSPVRHVHEGWDRMCGSRSSSAHRESTRKPRLCLSTEWGHTTLCLEGPYWKLCSTMPGGSAALPFVRSFYGQPSRYMWEDEFGEVHHIDQGEGGEQGDALMSLFFSLGQHAALEAARARLLPEKGSSRSWTTFTLSPLLVGSVSCTTSCKKSCIGMPASASTQGRLRFGMPLVTCHLLAIFWGGSHKLQTQRQGCGRDLECPQKNRGSTFWALHDVQAFLRRVTGRT